MIENCTSIIQSDIAIICVDSWEGGIEHQEGGGKRSEMSDVERRFDRNISLAVSQAKFNAEVRKIKNLSQFALHLLMYENKYEYFDLIYIDGSHQAPDVLTDAILSFQLLRVGGVMIFDDYLWSMDRPGSQDVLKMPKPAIDAFLNIFQRKMSIYTGPPINQIYSRNISK